MQPVTREARDAFRVAGSAKDQVEAALNGLEEIVEIVRQPAGKLAEGLHLVALAQGFLAPEVVGDVASDRVEAAARRVRFYTADETRTRWGSRRP